MRAVPLVRALPRPDWGTGAGGEGAKKTRRLGHCSRALAEVGPVTQVKQLGAVILDLGNVLVFHDNEKLFTEMAKTFGCSKEEFDTACRVSPFKSVLAAKLRLISEINEDEEWAYFDFWHKLMDGDFAEISNGCTASLCFNKATSDQITKHDTDELVAAYTSIFFKEAAQFDFFNNEEIDSIEFEISW